MKHYQKIAIFNRMIFSKNLKNLAQNFLMRMSEHFILLPRDGLRMYFMIKPCTRIIFSTFSKKYCCVLLFTSELKQITEGLLDALLICKLTS